MLLHYMCFHHLLNNSSSNSKFFISENMIFHFIIQNPIHLIPLEHYFALTHHYCFFQKYLRFSCSEPGSYNFYYYYYSVKFTNPYRLPSYYSNPRFLFLLKYMHSIVPTILLSNSSFLSKIGSNVPVAFFNFSIISPFLRFLH